MLYVTFMRDSINVKGGYQKDIRIVEILTNLTILKVGHVTFVRDLSIVVYSSDFANFDAKYLFLATSKKEFH